MAPKDHTGKWSLEEPNSDPYAKMIIGKKQHRTPVVKKSLNPGWNMKLMCLGAFGANTQEFVRITVFNANDFSSDVFMGQVAIPVVALYAAGLGVHRWWLPLQVQPHTIRLDSRL